VRKPERRTLSVEEAARLLGIGRTAAYEAVHRGQIPHIPIGRRLLVPRDALERLLDVGTQRGPQPPSA
jgi:excisionase family DNA binding protein